VNDPTNDAEKPKIVFPCEDYPIKVVARAGADVRVRVDAVFTRHFGEFEPTRVAERSSSQQNFVAFTYVMRVEHVAQLGALHSDLKADTDIVMVL
jgi:putative lipoic acid-binding regulatory protein